MHNKHSFRKLMAPYTNVNTNVRNYTKMKPNCIEMLELSDQKLRLLNLSALLLMFIYFYSADTRIMHNPKVACSWLYFTTEPVSCMRYGAHRTVSLLYLL